MFFSEDRGRACTQLDLPILEAVGSLSWAVVAVVT